MARQLYSKQEWKDLPEQDTPISAERLSHIEQGIYDSSNNMALREIYGDTTVNMGRKSETHIGSNSFSFGYNTTASGQYSHAEGIYTTASGYNSHAEGATVTASGDHSHAEGTVTTASGQYSHAEGNETTASGNYSHSEGYLTIASKSGSHSEGYNTRASGNYSHAEGTVTTASGQYSHAEGNGTRASGNYSHVEGKFNVEDIQNKYVHIVGGGESNANRKNIHTLDWEGNAMYTGTVESKGLILTDTVTGQKYIFTIANGSIDITEAE